MFLSLLYVLYVVLDSAALPFVQIFNRACLVRLMNHFPSLALVCALVIRVLVVSRNRICGWER